MASLAPALLLVLLLVAGEICHRQLQSALGLLTANKPLCHGRLPALFAALTQSHYFYSVSMANRLTGLRAWTGCRGVSSVACGTLSRLLPAVYPHWACIGTACTLRCAATSVL